MNVKSFGSLRLFKDFLFCLNLEGILFMVFIRSGLELVGILKKGILFIVKFFGE